MTLIRTVIHDPSLDIPVRRSPPLVGLARVKRERPPFYNGAAVWEALHRRALSWGDGGDDSAWLVANVNARVPCGDCRAHWAKVLREIPVRWCDYFAWSVEAHNAVNARLGKPILTLDDARARWGA